MKKQQQEFKVGDLVRIQRERGLSEERWQIKELGIGGVPCACRIAKWPECNDQKVALEYFDTSLLVVDNSGPQQLANLFRTDR